MITSGRLYIESEKNICGLGPSGGPVILQVYLHFCIKTRGKRYNTGPAAAPKGKILLDIKFFIIWVGRRSVKADTVVTVIAVADTDTAHVGLPHGVAKTIKPIVYGRNVCLI